MFCEVLTVRGLWGLGYGSNFVERTTITTHKALGLHVGFADVLVLSATEHIWATIFGRFQRKRGRFGWFVGFVSYSDSVLPVAVVSIVVAVVSTVVIVSMVVIVRIIVV